MYLDRFGFRLWSKWKPTSGAFFEARGTIVSSMIRYQTGGAKWVTMYRPRFLGHRIEAYAAMAAV